VYLVRADLEFALFGVVEQRRSEGLQSIEVSMNFGENQIRNFLEHVRSTYAAHKPFAPKPPIMTTAEVRPGLREVIRSEFPDIPVIAYQELLPDTNVNSLAKLGD
jgi:type III secretory pathway component EscV